MKRDTATRKPDKKTVRPAPVTDPNTTLNQEMEAIVKTVLCSRRLWILALVASFGCAMQQKQVEQQLANPAAINCHTADGDIPVLQQEKSNVAQRVVEGATAIYPAGLVVGLVTGTEGTKLQVAVGDYNDKIDARIAEIKQTCGIR